MSSKITNPYELFLDTDGDSLDGGSIYIGTAGLDAKTNQIQIYSDLLLTIPVAQPVSTINGRPTVNGSPVNIYVLPANYSTKTENSGGVVILDTLNHPSSGSITGSITVADISDLSAIDTAAYNTAIVSDPVRGGIFEYDVALIGTDDGGTIFSGWVRVYKDSASVKWFDAKGDGVTDDTVNFQKALDATTKTYVPPGIYMIKAHTDIGNDLAGIVPPDNSELILDKDAYLKAITNSNDLYSIIDLTGSDNVRVVNCNLIGEKDTHTGSTGEFGMGVFMRNASNITIDGGNISKCWGDGIYLGQISNVGTNKNITFNNVVCDDNSRNGITIISGDGVYGGNCELTNTIRIAPGAGLGIEPNNDDGTLERIHFVNLKTGGNLGAGFYVTTTHHSAVAYNTIDISIQNHIDDGSYQGATISRWFTAGLGSIRITDAIYKNNNVNGIQIRRWSSDGPKVILDSPTIIDANRDGKLTEDDGAPIGVLTLTGETPSTGSGNVEITNPVFRYTTPPTMLRKISLRDTTVGGLITNVVIKDVRDFDSDTWNLFAVAEWDPSTYLSKVGDRGEGAWVPSFFAYTGTAHTVSDMRYSKVGAITTITGKIEFAANADISQVRIGGMPQSAIFAGTMNGVVGDTNYARALRVLSFDTTSIRFQDDNHFNVRYADVSGLYINFTVTYINNV